MLRHGFVVMGFCFLLTAVYAQSATSASETAGTAQSNSGDQMPSIEQALASQFKLTKVTADGTDIVTAGSVLVLHKDGLLMFSADTKVPPTTTYKNGKLSTGFGSTFATDFALSQAQHGATSANVPQRKFVAGEKFWIIGYSVNNDGVTMKFYSDPYADVRYYGQVKFPFQKHTMPSTTDALQIIAEVVTVQSADDASGGGTPAPAPPVPVHEAQSEKAPDPIAPPPPPADAPPKTIAVGQTIEQVAATFGQPQKKAKVGTKEIYYYPDMKVTFVNGKVANVE